MSYCRFSSENYRCELYLYADIRGGYSLHVASNRVIGDIPEVPMINECNSEEWMAAHRAQMAFLEHCDRKPIGLKFDGAYFHLSEMAEVVEAIEGLAGLGYFVPEWLLPVLREELTQSA